MALRMGQFRHPYDPDASTLLPRPFQLGTLSRKSIAIHPYAPPKKVHFGRFKAGPFKEPDWYVPPHKRSGLRERRAVDWNDVRKWTQNEARQATGDSKARGGWYRLVRTIAIVNGSQVRFEYVYKRFDAPPEKVSSQFPTEQKLEYGQLRWLWLYHREQYWKSWKTIQQQRRERTADARDKYQRDVDEARAKYNRDVAKARAEHNAQRAKFLSWDKWYRAQFD